MQAELKVLRESVLHCKREKQILQTKAVQKAHVELLQNEAIMHARDQCSHQTQMQFSNHTPFSDDAHTCNKSSLNNSNPISKVMI